jgi:signal transduction histidine kinase
MQGEQGTNFETIRLRKDGSRITVSMTLSAIRNPEGKIVGMASTARNITEQKALQEQLNRAQRLEGLATLAGGIAHQFNNINTVVGGYLEIMRSVAGLPPRLVPYVEAATVGVKRAVDITDRLLILTEPVGVASNAVRLDELAKTLIALNEKRIEEEKVQLTLNLEETAPVQGEESRLKFVLSSIIANALDSLLDQPERKVGVRTGSTKDCVFFEVVDSGCGIPEEDLHRIFFPFSTMKGEWASSGSSQAKLKGVGLSLAISNRIVTESSGRIEVQSTKGMGSTFKVVIPLVL